MQTAYLISLLLLVGTVCFSESYPNDGQDLQNTQQPTNIPTMEQHPRPADLTEDSSVTKQPEFAPQPVPNNTTTVAPTTPTTANTTTVAPTTPTTPNTTTVAPTTPTTPNTTTVAPTTPTTPNATTVAPTTPTTPNTTTVAPTTPTTPNTTTVAPTTPTTPNTTTVAPTTPTVPTTTLSPNTTTTKPTAEPFITTVSPPSKDRRFDGPSFIGGIVLAVGLMAISLVAWKFYKARTERNYHTL